MELTTRRTWGAPVAVLATLALLLALLPTSHPAAQAVVSCDTAWTGDESNDWHDEDNWSDGLPGTSDVVCIDTDENLPVVHASGTTTIAQLQNNTTSDLGERLHISGGELTLTGSSLVEGDHDVRLSGGELVVQTGLTFADGAGLIFSGGTLSGTGTTTIESGAELHLTGGTKTLQGHVIDNGGTAVWDAGDLQPAGGSPELINRGTLTIDNTDAVVETGTRAVPVVTNAASGTLTKTGTGTATFTSTYYNLGATLVDEGVLVAERSADGVAMSGDVMIEAGGRFALSSSSAHIHHVTGTIAGPGFLQLGFAPNAGDVLLDGGTIDGPTVQISTFGSSLHLDDATITDGDITIGTGTTLRVDADSTVADTDLTLSGGSLEVEGDQTFSGELTWTAGTLSGAGSTRVTGSAAISGSAAKVLDGHDLTLAGSSSLTAAVDLADGAELRNEGTMEIEGGTIGGDGSFLNASGATLQDPFPALAVDSYLEVPFTNQGHVNVRERGLWLRAGGVHEGTGSTDRLDVSSSGRLHIDAPGRTFRIAPGTETYVFGAGEVIAEAGDLLIQSSDFQAAYDANIHDSGRLTSRGGTITIDADILVGEFLAANGEVTGSGDVRVIGGGILGNLVAWGDATISGSPSSLLRVETDLLLTGGSSVDRILEAGREVIVEGDVADRNTLAGVSNSDGTFTLEPGASVIIEGDYDQRGDTLLVDGTLAVAGSHEVHEDGAVGGTGTLTGSLLNAGLVAPGTSPGTLTIEGDYDQTVDGALEIELEGTGLGEFDVLEVGGSASLGGDLEVALLGGFTPAIGDTYVILTAVGGVDGTFASTDLPALPGDATMFVVYGDELVWLAVTDGSAPSTTPPVTVTPPNGDEPSGTPTNGDEPSGTPTSDDSAGAEDDAVPIDADTTAVDERLPSTGAATSALALLALLLLGLGVPMTRRQTVTTR